MAKIGTAHIELKPVLNEDSLDELAQQIEDRVAAAVQRGLNRGTKASHYDHVHWAMKPDGELIYDQGGIVPSGPITVTNDTSRPKPVFTANQFDALNGL